MPETTVTSPINGYAERLKAARRGLRDEYLQPHDQPWMIGFSGGKDSTLLLHLVLEAIRTVAPDERCRQLSEIPDSRSNVRRNGQPGRAGR